MHNIASAAFAMPFADNNNNFSYLPWLCHCRCTLGAPGLAHDCDYEIFAFDDCYLFLYLALRRSRAMNVFVVAVLWQQRWRTTDRITLSFCQIFYYRLSYRVFGGIQNTLACEITFARPFSLTLSLSLSARKRCWFAAIFSLLSTWTAQSFDRRKIALPSLAVDDKQHNDIHNKCKSVFLLEILLSAAFVHLFFFVLVIM